MRKIFRPADPPLRVCLSRGSKWLRSGRRRRLPSIAICITHWSPAPLALDFCPHPFLLPPSLRNFLSWFARVLFCCPSEGKHAPSLSLRLNTSRAAAAAEQSEADEGERERGKMTTTDSRTTASGEEQGTNEPRERERERERKAGRRRQEAQERTRARAQRGRAATTQDWKEEGAAAASGGREGLREESFRRLRLPRPMAAPVWK